MLLLRTAFKNILGGGKRTWLNVAVLSFVFVIMLAYNGMLDGWLEESRRDTMDWETGWSQLWHPEYDKFDIFSLQDAHGSIPSGAEPLLTQGTATPVLQIQASVYPQGRMYNVVVNGIPTGQQVLSIPSDKITAAAGEIPVIIGSRMAKSANLNEGDRIMMRWRDKNGVFDAREVGVAHIFNTKVGTVAHGKIELKIHGR